MKAFKFFELKEGEEATIRILDTQFWVHKIEPRDTQHKAGTLPGCPLCEAGHLVRIR
jgi:hypothetical protein